MKSGQMTREEDIYSLLFKAIATVGIVGTAVYHSTHAIRANSEYHAQRQAIVQVELARAPITEAKYLAATELSDKLTIEKRKEAQDSTLAALACIAASLTLGIGALQRNE